MEKMLIAFKKKITTKSYKSNKVTLFDRKNSVSVKCAFQSFCFSPVNQLF